MKKVLTVCMVIMMLASITVSAWAAPEGFVSSPSGNAAPTVEEFAPADEGCTATLVITPFADKATLPAELQKLFDQAYQSILNATDLTSLNAALKAAVEDKNINPQNLAISDLFDIHYTDCDFHDGHKDFDIVLGAETLGSFVGLLHMNKDGEWEWVEDAKVSSDGERLTFSVDSFSPFAIVVDTANLEVPPTGDNIMNYVWITVAVAAAFAATVVVFFISNKKNKVK